MWFIVGVVLGYTVGIFAASNIVLPLLWSWPKAQRLNREGRLVRPIPAGIFFVAPMVWGALVLGSMVLVSAVFPSAWIGYASALAIGFGQSIRLVWSPNDDMEADFAATFGSYLKAS
jgi:hypothetical protein